MSRKKPSFYQDGRAPFTPCRECSYAYAYEVSTIRQRLIVSNLAWSVTRALDRARIEHAKGVRS